jgi:hypothetical protein
MPYYMNAGLLQLFSTGVEDEAILNKPTITFFKYAYIVNVLFYKDDYFLEDVPIKWNDFYYFKVQRDIELMGPMWLKVSIPYFQIVENVTKTTTTVTSTSNINEIIYDNHDTFLVIIDSSYYYLIPNIFLTSPGINYYLTEIKFSDIKQYFNNIATINIDGDTTIQLLVYTPDKYNNHIIPFLLNQGNQFDKLMLSIILSDKDIYRKNLLTQNSFDLYTENQISDILITNFMAINKFTNNFYYSIYNIMIPEVEYYYQYHLNNITDSSINYDLYRAYNYSLTTSLSVSTDQFLKDTVTLNSLILQFFLLNINPSIYNTYNFYKKFSCTVYQYPVVYELSLLSSDIIDYNNIGATNLINAYYPKYYVNITAINNRLPFILSIDMIITTVEGYTLTYSIENKNNIFTIAATNTINLLELPILIQTGYTENFVDNAIINTDSNINTEWASNQIKSLTNLQNHTNIQNYLFDDYQKKYTLKENIIKNNFAIFNESNDTITKLWIELYTILTQYSKNNVDIGFDINNTFIDSFNTLSAQYNSIVSIQNIPLDLTFTYAVCINNFIYCTINKYFTDDTFLVFFYNKINSAIYQRYNRISNLLQINVGTFIGLLFYYNIELREYLTKQQINNYLTELFYMKSIICYIDISSSPLLLTLSNVENYTQSNIGGIPNCFHELKLSTSYNLFGKTIGFNGNTITFSFSNIYNTNSLALYSFYIDGIEYIVSSYKYNSPDTVFTTNNTIPLIYTSIYLKETIIQSIPSIDIVENTSNNNITSTVVLDTTNAINLFEAYNKVNILIELHSIVIISYQKNSINNIVVASYDPLNNILVSNNLDKNYLQYNKIEITLVVLPTTYLTITDSDCINPISSTYPYIELNKLSNFYIVNSGLFTTINTISSSNKHVRISNDIGNVLQLYCTAESFVGSSIDISIMNNSTLPNLYNYTSLNPNVSNLMDYMIQKPFLIQLQNTANAPVYCMANIPSFSIDTTMYLDGKIVNTLIELSSDQLVRDNNRLYPLYYYDGLLKDISINTTIKTTIQTLYDESYNGIYTDVINLIESTQDTYYQSMNEMITTINNTDTYGVSITSLYQEILPLNSMKYTSNLSSYLLDPTRYDVTNYDVYTTLAISLYNMKTVNGQSITVNNTLMTILSDRYTTTTKQLINSPWQMFDPSFRLSANLITVLSNYATYGERLLSFVDSNTSMLEITNYTNFPQNFSKEYVMRSKYIELTYNVERVNIELMYPNPWSAYLLNTSDDDISVKWMKDNNVVNVDSNGILYNATTELYKDKPIYSTSKLIGLSTFNLIGAIQIKDKMIVLDSSLDEQLRYIVLDNKTIVDRTYPPYNTVGINYNSYGLILNESTSYDFNQMTSSLYYYQISASNMSFDPTVDYIVSIKNTSGYMKYTGYYLVLLLQDKLILNENTIMFYNTTELSGSNLFYDIFYSNNNFVYPYQFQFTDIAISIASVYNYYNTIIWALSEFVIFKDSVCISQYYSDYIYLLGTVMLNLNETVSTITLQIYDTSSYTLPPLSIDKYNITVFNPLRDINWLEQKSNWISIDNIVCTVSSMKIALLNSTINNGNYLLYLSDTIEQPTIYKYPDIFYDTIQYTSEFNPYNNSYTVYGNIINTNFNPTNYVANNNTIENIVEVSDNVSITIYPQNKNITTSIVINSINLGYFNRPLMITHEEIVINYLLYDSSNNLTDSFIVVNTITTPPIFVRKIKFTENVSISTFSNLISLVKISSKEYNINYINNEDTSIVQMITLNVTQQGISEIIILWLYNGEYPSFNLLNGVNVITEPHYIDYLTQQTISVDNISFISVDTTLFNFINPTTIQTIINNVVPLTIKNKSYLSFDEMTQLVASPVLINSTIESVTQTNKNISSKLNTWVYIDNVNINSTIINSTALSQYTDYIFINNDTMYYNMKSSYINNTISLYESMTITSGDAYVYPFQPIFIECSLSCTNIDNTMFLYTSVDLLQRNEIIKIGSMIVIINFWSNNSKSYIGTILNSIDTIPNIVIGYYSYGVFSNYYERNILLNCDISSLLYGVDNSSNQLIVGDYYIDNNTMQLYEGQTTSDFIFKFKKGQYINLYKINSNWYYDDLIYRIVSGMQLIYQDAYTYTKLVVQMVTGNMITFVTNTIDLSVIKCYVSIQPFTSQDIIINESINNSTYNSTIDNLDNFNGWIITNDNSFYKVKNSIIDGDISSSNLQVRLFNLDNMIIKDDFTNFYNISTEMPNASNNKLPVNITCTINVDEEYVYFTPTINFNFTNLIYYYNQYILVASNHFRLINITSSRVYIDILSSSLDIILPFYQVIFSAGNINRIDVVSSSSYILNSSYKLDYPIIENTTNGKLIVLLSSPSNNISKTIDDIEIINNVISSNQLTQMGTFSNMTTNYFYENYIPINIDSNVITPIPLELQTGNNILLQEITNEGPIYQHYINIVKINSMFKISSNNDFHNINTSIFYLHCTIPVTITKNNYIVINSDFLILQPEVSSPINTLQRNTLVATVYLKTNTIGKPIKVQNNWKYMINFNSSKYQLIKTIERTTYYNDNIECKILFESANYYILSPYLIDRLTSVYFNETEYIETTYIESKTIKPEFTTLQSTVFNNISQEYMFPLKIVNRVNITDNNLYYTATIIDNNNNNATFGVIDGVNYLGDNNLIKNILLQSNTYSINPTYSLRPLSMNWAENPIYITPSTPLYNLCKDYTVSRFIIEKPELSTSLPSLETYLNYTGIEFNYIASIVRPWREWSMITTRFNYDLGVYLNNMNIVYDGYNFSYSSDSVYTSYFTTNETTSIESTLKTFYQGNILQGYKLNILFELYKVEIYLMREISLYLSQDYFWKNTIFILTQLLKNFNGSYKWTLYNNVIMIIQNNVLELDLYPSNFTLNNNILVRTNYFSSDIDISTSNNKMTISRNPIIIDTMFNNVINRFEFNINSLYGTSMDSVIIEILNLATYKSNIITSQPIFYQLMDSLKYYIAKMYKENSFNLAELTNLDSVVSNYTNNITGKYFDYLFNEKYFGLSSLTKYTTLAQPAINTLYIEPKQVGQLSIYSIDENSINKIETNNIFTYKLNFNDMMIQSPELELIKSTNQYTIDILDNYQHMDNITIDLTQITTDSLSFYSNKIIEPMDISVVVQEQYTITNKILYGSMYLVVLDGYITSDDIITYDSFNVLYLENVSNTSYKIASPPIDLTVCNILKVILNVAIKNTNISNNKTYLVLSDNISTDYNYIEINNTIYELHTDIDGYYIDSVITVVINTIYDAIRFVSIISREIINTLVSDITVDRSINPIDYNTIDPQMLPCFSIENTVIQSATILTPTTIRLYYTKTLGSTITHTYNLKESIPYRINSITNQLKYFYSMDNINSIRLTDSITIYNDIISYSASIYNITNSNTLVTFSLPSNVLSSELNSMVLQIIKIYPLTLISIENTTITTGIPSDFTDYNYDYTYIVTINDVKYNIILDIINRTNPVFSITLPIILDSTIQYIISLEQKLTIENNTITSMQFNTLYQVSTILDSTVQNTSNFNQPVVQFLDSTMNKFNATNYYQFDNNVNFLVEYTSLYIVYNNNYIEATIVMIQLNQIIVGINTLIEPSTVKIYSSDFKYSGIVILNLASYIYQKGQVLEQISPNQYMMLFSNDSLENYNIDSNLTSNNVILSFKYSDIKCTNESYPLVGYNSVPDTITTTKIQTVTNSDVEWVDNLAIRLFNSIQLSIDDAIITNLDYYTYSIYKYYMVDNWKRDEFDKMTRIRYDTNNNLFFFLPIITTLEPKSFLPIKKMNRSVVKFKFNTSKLTDLILNQKTSFSKLVYPSIDIHYDYIVSNNKSSIKPEYILYRVLYSYQNFILNNIEEYNHINLYNRTIDLFLITTNNGVSQYQIANGYSRDIWYSEYIENSIIDINIFDLIDNEIKIKSHRYIVLSSTKIIIDIRFAMYLDEKYLQYINENLNDTNLFYSQKITILVLYFTRIYRNQSIIKSTDIISSINIYIDGHELLPQLPASYSNNVIPYLKGNILPDGYYMYSFAIDSLNTQPNGMLNLKNVKDLEVYTVQNVANQGIKLKICSHEYRILKIENNVGRLQS